MSCDEERIEPGSLTWAWQSCDHKGKTIWYAKWSEKWEEYEYGVGFVTFHTRPPIPIEDPKGNSEGSHPGIYTWEEDLLGCDNWYEWWWGWWHLNAENFCECFAAAIQAAHRWSPPQLILPPSHGEYKGLWILQPLTHRESLLACSFGKLLEQLTAGISKDAFPNLISMGLTGPATVLCLVQPACLYIYHSQDA